MTSGQPVTFLLVLVVLLVLLVSVRGFQVSSTTYLSGGCGQEDIWREAVSMSGDCVFGGQGATIVNCSANDPTSAWDYRVFHPSECANLEFAVPTTWVRSASIVPDDSQPTDLCFALAKRAFVRVRCSL
jgi:hypothetical protein